MDKLNYKGYTIEISHDDLSESPREWDNLTKMICFHRRYDLGDAHDFTVDSLQEFIKENSKDIYFLPLYLYDHSGLTLSVKPFSCPWDSGQLGVVYIEKKTLLDNWPELSIKELEAKAYEVIKQEVNTYNQYLQGDVWYYNVENVDSCGGFYGYEYCVTEAKSAIDGHVKNELQKHQVKLKQQIINKVNLSYRKEFNINKTTQL